MSYQVFKAEILAGNVKPHNSKTKPARVIASAYTNLIMRHFETLTGGGQYLTAKAKQPILQASLQKIFTASLSEQSRKNQLQKWDNAIYTFWKGAVIPGPLGVVTINNTGKWVAPYIPENSDNEIWLKILLGVIATHLKTMTGMYLNFVTGATTSWSSALLVTFP